MDHDTRRREGLEDFPAPRDTLRPQRHHHRRLAHAGVTDRLRGQDQLADRRSPQHGDVVVVFLGGFQAGVQTRQAEQLARREDALAGAAEQQHFLARGADGRKPRCHGERGRHHPLGGREFAVVFPEFTALVCGDRALGRCELAEGLLDGLGCQTVAFRKPARADPPDVHHRKPLELDRALDDVGQIVAVGRAADPIRGAGRLRHLAHI